MNIPSVAAVALLVPMLGVAVANLLFAPRLRRSARPSGPLPRVSLLVPARDEEINLREHLPGWLGSDYPELEILILDDASTDATADVVRSHDGGPPDEPASGARLALLAGNPLPAGWLGKPWACHQLATAARGDVLIFCDADVALAPEAVSATVATMHTQGADVLTAFPRQRLDGPLLAAVVPLIANLTVGALLPLPLVPRRWPRSAVVGNGQWLAFTRAAYERCGGHDAVRAEIVEDVELARRAKRASLRVLATLAPDLLTVRMYRNSAAMVEGFTKNAFHLAGGTSARAAGLGSVFALVGVYPLIGLLLGLSGARSAAMLLAGVRICVAITFRHGPATILLHPVGAIATLWILARSTRGASRGTLLWKGRRLVTTPTNG